MIGVIFNIAIFTPSVMETLICEFYNKEVVIMFGRDSCGDTGRGISSFLSSTAGELLLLIGVFTLGGAMYRSGQDQGQRVANKILRRHDKDVRRLEKKTEKYLKKKEQNERRERDREEQGWFRLIRND